MMSQKLGFHSADIKLKEQSNEGDERLFLELETLLSEVESDMTIFYRLLADFNYDDETRANNIAHFSDCFYQVEPLNSDHQKRFVLWLQHYDQRIQADNITQPIRKVAMNKVNPKYVLRNYLAQQAITLAEQGDYSQLNDLQKVLKNPYKEQMSFHHFSEKRPEWARNKAGCSMLSCSS